MCLDVPVPGVAKLRTAMKADLISQKMWTKDDFDPKNNDVEHCANNRRCPVKVRDVPQPGKSDDPTVGVVGLERQCKSFGFYSNARVAINANDKADAADDNVEAAFFEKSEQEKKLVAATFNQGDTIGCGINIANQEVFFTKQKVKKGAAVYVGSADYHACKAKRDDKAEFMPVVSFVNVVTAKVKLSWKKSDALCKSLDACQLIPPWTVAAAHSFIA